MQRPPVIASYGAGLNSTAMLVGLIQKQELFDLVLFSDTGGERPDTYDYIKTFDAWLREQGCPGITVVQRVNYRQEPITLEGLCQEKKMLPSLAYGWKSCSIKHKVDPQVKFVNHWEPAIEAWTSGQKVVKLLGYDANEHRRVANAKTKIDAKYDHRYPLYEWGWDRDRCIQAVQEAGLPVPGKSSCFFCPAMKKPEIVDLGRRYPDLLQRALDMEDDAQAGLTSVKGLGRRFSWRDYTEEQGLLDESGKVKKSIPLPTIQSDEEDDDVPCECFDGACTIQADPTASGPLHFP